MNYCTVLAPGVAWPAYIPSGHIMGTSIPDDKPKDMRLNHLEAGDIVLSYLAEHPQSSVKSIHYGTDLPEIAIYTVMQRLIYKNQVTRQRGPQPGIHQEVWLHSLRRSA